MEGGVTIAVHWVARTRGGFRGVCRGASARWLWRHLRAVFPRAYALCLMPDHVHLIVPGRADLASFRRVLAHHGRLFGCAWHRADATPCTTAEILLRAVRYVILNPVRAQLVSDPWAWPWSTLRELGGVVVDDWTRAAVRGLTRAPWARVLERLTQLDDGTAPARPRPASGDAPVVASLSAIAAAAASSLRTDPGDISTRGPTRRLFVQLALSVGYPRLGDLAQACGVRPRAIREAAREGDHEDLRRALRCLRDERLRIHDAPEPTASARRGLRRAG